MKHLSNERIKIKNVLLYSICIASLLMAGGCKKWKDIPAPVLHISTLADGLIGPIGLEVDKKGLVWVAETGTGNNDGKVTVIKHDGTKYDAIINFESVITEGGETEGPSHLLFADGLLYVLGANGKMYKANVNAFKPGDAPLNASNLIVENIGAFVLAYNFVNNTHETHPYGITKAPDGSIYITDAAANAIIHRAKSGALSILAEVPGIANPTPVGPPQIQSVPTGIIPDQQNFLVTTLLGFPFPAGKAIIYKITKGGAVSIYQEGFTTLVDITEGGPCGHLVLEHGTFGPMGFIPNTGKLVWANGTDATTLADGLNLPAGMKQANEHTWYVTSLGNGSVLKVTY